MIMWRGADTLPSSQKMDLKEFDEGQVPFAICWDSDYAPALPWNSWTDSKIQRPKQKTSQTSWLLLALRMPPSTHLDPKGSDHP